MNHLDIIWTNQFKKDYKQALKRHLNIDLLEPEHTVTYLENKKYGAD